MKRNPENHFSVKKQLIFGITLVHAILMTIFVLDMNYRQKQFLKDDAEENAKELAETIANNSISWVLANDVVGLQEIVSSQKAKSKVNDVMVISNENKILAHSDKSKVGKYIVGSNIEALLKNQTDIAIVGSGADWVGAIASINVQNRNIGKVYVSLNLKDVNKALLGIIIDGLIYTLLAILVGALFAWFMAQYLTRGILALASVSAKIKEGQRGLRAKVFKKDEVGQLTDDFNAMLDAMEAKEKNLIEIQESLSEAKELADVASKSKADFLANMSHEIRTPLNAVIGFCEVLEDTNLDVEQKEFLSRVKNSGQVLQYLIDDILEFSRIESASISLENLPFNLANELKKVIEMHELKIKQKSLAFHLVLSPEIPNTMIGDAFRLNQILNNLMSNAIKFTSAGRIDLCARVISQEHNILKLEFRVKDTGIGIHRERLKFLFNPFTQADSSITKKYGGTGLGLTISRRIAFLMRGNLLVESQYNVGSTFILTVEFESVTERTLGMEMEIRELKIIEERDSLEFLNLFKNKTVLVVDDNILNLELAGLTLKKFGLNILFSENGKEAVETVEQKGGEIDLILMDLQMPILDGFRAAEEIRKLPNGAKIPIVAISARAFDSDREKCLECGMNDHIAKPFVRKELLDKLKKYL